MKKFVLAAVIAYVVLMGTNYLIHGVWLAPDYSALPGSFRAPQIIQQKFWVMMVGQALFALMLVWVYRRGAEKKSWMGQGIRYGIVITLLAVIPYALSQYVTFVLTYPLVVKWIVAEGAQMILLGLIIAAITQEKTA
jgi:hypothetical protein